MSFPLLVRELLEIGLIGVTYVVHETVHRAELGGAANDRARRNRDFSEVADDTDWRADVGPGGL